PMSRLIVLALVAALVSVIPTGAYAQSNDLQDKKIADLTAKIEKLEARVAQLEKQLATGRPAAQSDGRAPEAQIQQLKNQARARMRKDRDKYTPQQIQEAEQLYQTANKNWR